jgi:hypothetical protein
MLGAVIKGEVNAIILTTTIQKCMYNANKRHPHAKSMSSSVSLFREHSHSFEQPAFIAVQLEKKTLPSVVLDDRDAQYFG